MASKEGGKLPKGVVRMGTSAGWVEAVDVIDNQPPIDESVADGQVIRAGSSAKDVRPRRRFQVLSLIPVPFVRSPWKRR